MGEELKIKTMTNDIIKKESEAYAESFRLIPETSGWKEQKVRDFIAGYDSCLERFNKEGFTTDQQNAIWWVIQTISKEFHKNPKRIWRRDEIFEMIKSEMY